jgi:phage/plasmid-like protein (TIGR03299 family)
VSQPIYLVSQEDGSCFCDWSLTGTEYQRSLTGAEHQNSECGTGQAKATEVPGYSAFIRDSDESLLNVARSSYTPIQNIEMFEFVEALTDDPDVKFDTAGSLRNGKTVFATVRVGEDFKVGGVDGCMPYLVISNGHDGTQAFRASATPVRVVCMNTLRFSQMAAQATWSVRHTSGATSKIAEARKALGFQFKYLEKFQAEAEQLIETEVNDQTFYAIVKDLFPNRDPEEKDALMERRRDTVWNLWENSPTIGDFKHTGWGAVNAVNEWEGWSLRAQTTSLTQQAQREKRALRAVSDPFPMTNRTLAAVKELQDA